MRKKLVVTVKRRSRAIFGSETGWPVIRARSDQIPTPVMPQVASRTNGRRYRRSTTDSMASWTPVLPSRLRDASQEARAINRMACSLVYAE